MKNKDKIHCDNNDQINCCYTSVPLKKYLEMSIDIDLDYQSNSRWEEREQQSYIESLLKNSAPDAFKFVAVKKCLKNAKNLKQNTEGSRSREYYNKWNDKGVEFLNLDGNNRYITIKKFFNDELEMLPCTFPYPSKSNKKYSVQIKTKWKFSSLTQETQDDIKDHISVSINEYTQITVEQMKDLFIRSNSGRALNRDEKRNAIDSYSVDLIREMTKEFDSLWICNVGEVYAEVDKNRRKPDNLIVKLMYNYCYNNDLSVTNNDFRSVTDNNLDDACKSGAIFDKKRKEIKKFLIGFFDFIKNHEKILKGLRNKNKKFLINSTFDIAYMYHKKWQDHKYETQKKHLQKFVNIYNHLINDTQPAYIEIGHVGKLHTFRSILKSAETNRLRKRLELYENELKSCKWS